MSISSLCGNGMPTVSDDNPQQLLPRLLYVATSRNDGGLERYSVQMAASLASAGADIRFACAPGEIIETLCRASGIETLPLTTRNSADFQCARVLADQIIRHDIEIVHVHSRRDYVTATLAVANARRQMKASGRRPQLILHAHMLRPLGMPLWLSGRFFQWGVDAVLANSNTVRDLLIECHSLPKSFVQLLHNGIELDRFASPHSPEAALLRTQTRREWAISDEALVLGMVGRLDAKGQAALLEVMPEMMLKYPSLRVILVGSEGMPGERERLTAMANASGFADRLLFTGPREDVPTLLTAFDVLVHLPLDESFGLALTETMAAGLPTVATDIGGCREVVQDGVTGTLVPPGDAAALVTALDKLLDPKEGPTRRAEMGRAGRYAVEARFSLERQMQILSGIYIKMGRTPEPQTVGRRWQTVPRTRWTATALVLAVLAGGFFAHSLSRHTASHQKHPAHFAHSPVHAKVARAALLVHP